MPKLFLPQATLEEWLMNDKADLKEGQLVASGDPLRLPASAAVHFVMVVSGNDDNRLLSRVKTEEQLAKLGAEHMADSVVIGEDAYTVENGYLTEIELQKEAPVSKRPERAAPAKPEMSADAQALADLFLNKLP